MICQRCLKTLSAEGVHTCTPTELVRKLEADLAAMTAERDHWREANRTSLAAGEILKEQLAAMTKKADGFFDALQLAAKINAEGQAREQRFRDVVEVVRSHSTIETSREVIAAINRLDDLEAGK